MNAESYARVKQLFGEAVELEPEAWPTFLDERCASDDPAVRREVEVLLENHRPDTILLVKGVPAARPPARFRHATSAMARELQGGWKRHRRVTLVTLGLVLAVLGIGSWVAWKVESSFEKAARLSLGNAVSRTASLLEQWRVSAEFLPPWVRGAEVQAAVEELLATEDSREALRANPAAAALREEIAPLLAIFERPLVRPLREHDYRDYLLFDFTRQQLIACSQRFEPRLGDAASPLGSQALQDCRQRGPTFKLPFRAEDLLAGGGEPGDAVIAYGVSIHLGTPAEVATAERERKAPAAVLFLLLTPALRLGDFSTDASESLETPSDTFLFDARGRLLTNLSCDEKLREAGLLEEGDRNSALDLVLRDPGRRLTAGDHAVAAERPLTRLATVAIAHREAPSSTPEVLYEPYRDLLGREVIGAWLWLDDLDVGLATEVEADLVFASVEAIDSAEKILLALVLVLGIAAAYSSHSAEVLSLEVSAGQSLGQYVLLELIGEGGLGQVYKARHALLQRITAVKLLRKQAVSEAALERFAVEVRQTSKLTHPNTIQIYDYGRSESGVFYYAMEYLPGITLAELLEREGPLSIGRVLHLLRQVLGSLAEAHGAGLIHRDIKPQNIMLSRRGGQCDVVKVLDFGLVKCIDSAADPELTAEGMISGTPLYISPDRYAGRRRPDGRTDLYAVGTLAYLMITGKPPFDGETRMDLCRAVMKAPVPLTSDRSPGPVPHELDQLILSAMAKDPEDRPASAEAMIEVLERLQHEFPWSRADAVDWWAGQSEPE